LLRHDVCSRAPYPGVGYEGHCAAPLMFRRRYVSLRLRDHRTDDWRNLIQPCRAAQTSGTQKTVTPASQSGYVGSDICEAFHTQGESLKGTPHARVATRELPRLRTAARVATAPGQHVDSEAKGHIRKSGQVTPGETNPHVSELSQRRIKSGSGFCTERDGTKTQSKESHPCLTTT
jgi:hypothetical protein